MRVGSVHPGRWEERTRGEVLALIDGCIHRYNHDCIRQSWLDEPGTMPADPWIGRVINSKKKPPLSVFLFMYFFLGKIPS